MTDMETDDVVYSIVDEDKDCQHEIIAEHQNDDGIVPTAESTLSSDSESIVLNVNDYITLDALEEQMELLNDFLKNPFDAKLGDKCICPGYKAYRLLFKRTAPDRKIKQIVWINPTMAPTWMLLPNPPKFFEHQFAILRNHVQQGLLHSILRHTEDWKYIIPTLKEMLEKFPETFLDSVKKIQHPSNLESPVVNRPKITRNQKKKLMAECANLYKQLDPQYKKALAKMQYEAYEYVMKCMKGKYRGPCVEEPTALQFEAEEFNKQYVLIVCYRALLSIPMGENLSERNDAYQILTIYFNTLAEGDDKLKEKKKA